MIHESMEFHNVAELRRIDGREGRLLQRVPERVRRRLEEPARRVTMAPAGVEIRFLMLGDSARVTLSCPEGESDVTVCFGPFITCEKIALTAQPRAIEISLPPRLEAVFDRAAGTLAFAPTLVRLMMAHTGQVHFHGVEGDVRPPEPGETPRPRMLAYGTSITHGGCSSRSHLSYAYQTAWRLGADLLNLGVSGACRCEPAFADCIAARSDWSFATLCLSVNMLNGGFTAETFAERARYLIARVADANSARPVFPFTILPYSADWEDLKPRAVATVGAYRQALRDVVADLARENVHLLEGPDLLTDVGGLTVDMIHPSDLGMIEIGRNLSARLQPILRERGIL